MVNFIIFSIIAVKNIHKDKFIFLLVYSVVLFAILYIA